MNTVESSLLAALAGAGLYGGTRMVHNALDKVDNLNKKPDPYGVSGDKIVIKLPHKHDPNAPHQDIPAQQKHAESNAIGIPLGIASFAAGLYGANKLHDAYTKRNADKELQEAHNKYHAALAKLQNQTREKTASTTPIIDAMCEKIASELEKDAGLASLWSMQSTPHGNDVWADQDTLSNVPLLGSAMQKGKDFGWEKVVAPGLALGGSYMALKFLADRTKAKREEDAAAKQKLPTQIVIDQR